MTSSQFPLSAAAAAVVVLTLCYLLYRSALPHPIPGIPYHKASAKRILGDAPDMIRHRDKTEEVFDWMAAQFAELGSPIIQLFVRPLGRPFVLVADFRECQDILVRRAKEFDRSTFFSDMFVGLLPNWHLVMPTNDTFRKQRRLISDTMSPAFLHKVAGPRVYEAALDLVELWRLKSVLANHHPFDAPDDLYHAGLDIIWAATFGADIGSNKSQSQLLATLSGVNMPEREDTPVVFPKAATPADFNSVITLTDSIGVTIRSPFPRWQYWYLKQFPYMRSALAFKDRFLTEALRQAEKTFFHAAERDSSTKSALEHILHRELAAAEKEGRVPQYVLPVLPIFLVIAAHEASATDLTESYNTPATKDEIFGFLLAGHETTSTTLSWALKFLTDHQKVQHELRRALRAELTGGAAGGTNPSAMEIATCHVPYLDATLEEILRCATTASTHIRVAKVDTEVLGHRIPKGTDVFCMVNGPSIKSAPIQIDERLRSDASRNAKDQTGVWDATNIGLFVPERWLKQNEKGEVGFDSKAGPNAPFGLGPRGCFGRKLAELELRIVLVLLVWNFEFQPTPPELSSHRAVDMSTHHPQQCYVRLRTVGMK